MKKYKIAVAGTGYVGLSIANVMALFTVLPLAIAFIAFVGKAKVLLNNKFLLGAGTVSCGFSITVPC